MAKPFPVFTTGYEGLIQDQLLDRLTASGVTLLLDIRAIAQSRKPGFSKTLLGASAKSKGMEYLHLRALGTPKAGRIAARAGRVAEMEAVFAAHLATDPAQAALAQAITVTARQPTCLLCFERDPHFCHRRLVAEAVAARTGQPIHHL